MEQEAQQVFYQLLLWLPYCTWHALDDTDDELLLTF